MLRRTLRERRAGYRISCESIMSSLSISGDKAIGLGRCARWVIDIAPLRIGCETSPQEDGMRKPAQALGLISGAAWNASRERVEQTTAAPALTDTATPSTSAMSSLVAPRSRAAAV